jgi:putative transposase
MSAPSACRGLFNQIDKALLADIGSAAKSGMALGNERFNQQVATLTGRRQRVEKRGRPAG